MRIRGHIFELYNNLRKQNCFSRITLKSTFLRDYIVGLNQRMYTSFKLKYFEKLQINNLQKV